jgi:hypothetical protein
MGHKYIEVMQMNSHPTGWSATCVQRVDVTGKSEREVERVERGMLINMDRDRFFTQVHESPEPLPLKPS